MCENQKEVHTRVPLDSVPGGNTLQTMPEKSSRSIGWTRAYDRTVLALCTFFVALTFAILRITTLSEGFGVRLAAPWALIDFRGTVYDPTVRFLDGGNPYDRIIAPFLPSSFLLHLPFGLLPFRTASELYFVAVVALTIGVAYASFKFSGLRARAAGVTFVAALILLSRPGQWNLLLGQLAAQLTLATYLALYYARSRPALSGVGLAIAMIKPTFGFPLAVLMLARGDTRAVLLGCGIAGAVNLPLLAIAAGRAGGIGKLAVQIAEVQREVEMRAWNNPAISIARVDGTALISRLIGVPLTGLAQVPVAMAVLGWAVLALRTMRGVTGDRARFSASASIICPAILLCVYHQAYDMVVLTLPAVALAYSLVPGALRTSRLRKFLLGLIVMLAANYAATGAVLDHLRPSRELWLIITSLNGAGLLIFLVVCSFTVGRSRPEPGSERPSDATSVSKWARALRSLKIHRGQPRASSTLPGATTLASPSRTSPDTCP